MTDHTDASWLRERYHGDGATLEEMADDAGVATGTVWKWMERHDIERRGHGGGSDNPGAKRLRELYHDEEAPLDEMADELDVTKQTVLQWMNETGIERTRSESGRPPGDELKQLYEDDELSGPEMADRLGVHLNTVYRWLDEAGVEREPGGGSRGFSPEGGEGGRGGLPDWLDEGSLAAAVEGAADWAEACEALGWHDERAVRREAGRIGAEPWGESLPRTLEGFTEADPRGRAEEASARAEGPTSGGKYADLFVELTGEEEVGVHFS